MSVVLYALDEGDAHQKVLDPRGVVQAAQLLVCDVPKPENRVFAIAKVLEVDGEAQHTHQVEAVVFEPRRKVDLCALSLPQSLDQ